jgi:hypothetical protein
MPLACHLQPGPPVKGAQLLARQPRRTWLLALALASLGEAACGSSGDTRAAPALAASFPDAAGAGVDGGEGASGCARAAQEGCACTEVGKAAFCGWIFFHSGNYKACTHGSATCGQDLLWGKCVGSGAPVYASQN